MGTNGIPNGWVAHTMMKAWMAGASKDSQMPLKINPFDGLVAVHFSRGLVGRHTTSGTGDQTSCSDNRCNGSQKPVRNREHSHQGPAALPTWFHICCRVARYVSSTPHPTGCV